MVLRNGLFFLKNSVRVSQKKCRATVTASLIVESISNMRDGRARISYVAFDSDDHLSRAQRTVRFTDYKKPSFSFTRGMEFRLSGNIDILKYIEAQDVLDGDISDKVK